MTLLPAPSLPEWDEFEYCLSFHFYWPRKIMRFDAWKCATTIAIVACLSGCGERPEAVGVSPPLAAPVAEVGATPGLPATPAAGTTTAATATATATVWFVPAALEDCAPPQVGTIHWNASKSSAESVDVKIVREDGGENLFASNGPVGSQVTEPWLRAGLLVIVRDQATGVELGRNTVAGKPCSR